MKDKTSKCKVMIAVPVLLKGGTEVQTLSVVRILIAHGYSVAVCCYYEFDESIVSQFKEVGANVILVGLSRSNGEFGIRKMLELIRNLVTRFRESDPDLIHVQYLAPGLIPIIAARIAGISGIFATVHIAGSTVYGFKAKMLLRIATRLCTVFFCVSRGVEEFWFGNSAVLDPANIERGRKHFTIYNAIDIAEIEQVINGIDYEELKRSLGIAGKKVVGIVGRLAPQKGHTLLLDAMVEILREIPDVMLLIIGDGPDRAFLEMKAQKLNISKNIVWLGSKQQEEVFRLYSMMDIFVMPSLYEGFGLAAAEAMAAGKPVIASNVEGLSEIVQDGINGLLVSPGDKKALSGAIIKLLSDPTKASLMGARGRQVVRKDFSLERFQSTILAAYTHFSQM